MTRPRVVLAVILVCQLMVVLDATIVNVALPKIQAALGFSTAQPVVGHQRLRPHLRRPAAARGPRGRPARPPPYVPRRHRLFTVASLAGGLATTPAALLAARAAQGVGGALAAPSALALLTTMFAEGRERMRALGYYTAVSIGGTAVGLVAGGILTEWASWRWVMFVNVPIGVALLVAARSVVPETARHTAASTSPVRSRRRSAWPRSSSASSRRRPTGWGGRHGRSPSPPASRCSPLSS